MPKVIVSADVVKVGLDPPKSVPAEVYVVAPPVVYTVPFRFRSAVAALPILVTPVTPALLVEDPILDVNVMSPSPPASLISKLASAVVVPIAPVTVTFPVAETISRFLLVPVVESIVELNVIVPSLFEASVSIATVAALIETGPVNVTLFVALSDVVIFPSRVMPSLPVMLTEWISFPVPIAATITFSFVEALSVDAFAFRTSTSSEVPKILPSKSIRPPTLFTVSVPFATVTFPVKVIVSADVVKVGLDPPKSVPAEA